MDEGFIGPHKGALPVRYPYRPPQWVLFVGPLGLGADWVWQAFGGHHPLGWIITASFIFISVLGLINHFACKRYLELGEDAIFIPSGFLHRRFVRIPYELIDWAGSLRDERFLHVHAEHMKAEIPRMFLRKKDFEAIKAFLLPLAAKKMAQRRQELLTHPELDHRHPAHQSAKALDASITASITLPTRDAFIAFWPEKDIFRWRKLLPAAFYVGGLGSFAVMVRWVDPAGQFFVLYLAIAIAYTILAPTITWRRYRKKYARFIRCHHCGDWFGLDLNDNFPLDGSNLKREIIAQSGHCVKCGAPILANESPAE